VECAPGKLSLPLTAAVEASITCKVKLWRSGIFWSVLSFVSGLGNLVCSSIIAHNLNASKGEFGFSSSALDFVTFLGLPLTMFSMSVVHYIAYFRSKNDEARLQGLLAGCQKLLFWATVGGSLLAIVVWVPLGRFFDFQKASLLLAVLICLLVSCWSGLGVALCQGMSWFKRLAIIGVVAVGVRLLFAWVMTARYPTAAMALTSTTASLLANFILFYWWKDIFRHPAQRISPWNREFVQFLLVTGATVGGSYFFTTGDSLVSKKYFVGATLDAYQMASKFGRAIPQTVLPLLMVTFTSRSGSKETAAKTDQRILLSLYAAGLACGAAVLILFRQQVLRVYLGHPNPQAAGMIIPFSITMVLIGLNQAVGMWSLADRTFKIALLYGGLGLAYWTTLLLLGKTPSVLLLAMPIGAGVSFCVLCACWLAGRYRKT
jgi:O-antigen/teichoic acid export membrane protein